MSHEVALISGGFMNGDQLGVSIYISPDRRDFFAVTLDRANVTAGYYSVEDSVANFSIGASWAGDHYIQSLSRATYSTFVIRSLTSTKAVIELSAKLLSAASGKFLVLALSTIRIHSDLLYKLVTPERRIPKCLAIGKINIELILACSCNASFTPL